MGKIGRLFFSKYGLNNMSYCTCYSYNVILALLPLSSEGHVLLLWTWAGLCDTLQLLSPDYKNAMHFCLALWGQSLWEPSLHVMRKLNPGYVEGPYICRSPERMRRKMPCLSHLKSPLPFQLQPPSVCLYRSHTLRQETLSPALPEFLRHGNYGRREGGGGSNPLYHRSELLYSSNIRNTLFSQNYLTSIWYLLQIYLGNYHLLRSTRYIWN